MSIANSKNIQQTSGGILVLLIESDKGSLQRHANQLLLHSNRVTRTTKASIGLSKILDGDIFHFVFIDAERCELDIMEFLYCSLKNRPQLPIVVMGSVDIQGQIESLAQQYKAVSFLRKPYADGELSNILKRFSIERMSCGEGSSTSKCVEDNLESNIVHKVDTAWVGSSANPNSMIMYNRLSSADGTHKGQPITIVDLSRDDDGPSMQKSICIGTEKDEGKGKNRMEIKRKGYLSVEDDTYLFKRKEIKTHTPWMPAPLDALDKKEDYPDSLLRDTNVLGLTRSNHVANHLQGYIEKESNLKAESYAYTRSGIPAPYDNNTSIPETSNLQREPMLNSYGVSFMTIDSIREKLNGVTPFNLPRESTKTISNSAGVCQPIRGDTYPTSSGFGLAKNLQSSTGPANKAQISAFGYGNAIEPLVPGGCFSNRVSGKEMRHLDVGAMVVPQFDLGTDNYIYLNDFANASSLVSCGSIYRESFAPYDRFGVPVDQHLLYTSDAITGSAKVGSEKLYFRNLESLFDVESSKTRNCSDTDAATIGNVSASDLGLPGEESDTQTQTGTPLNSVVHLSRSMSRLTEEHWSQKMIQHEPEIITEDVNEECGHLIIGRFGYSVDIVDHL